MRLKHIIEFKDLMQLYDSDEYLIEFFPIAHFKSKLLYLTEYYKFHKDIPRFFESPHNEIVSKYHDRRRRVQYYKIKKILREQNGDQNDSLTKYTDSSL